MKSPIATLTAIAVAFGLGAAAQASTLPDEVEEAILEALMDEYKAEATYAALIEEFGANTAFSNIMVAEQKHADALIRLLEKYDAEVPDNPYLDGTLTLGDLPETLADAYGAGVIGEIENLSLYRDDLLPVVSDYSDITRVFTNLLTASQTKHLPTFTDCADGGCNDGIATTRAQAPADSVKADRAERASRGTAGGRGGQGRSGNGGGNGGKGGGKGRG